jgi:hypothetical protein
MKKIACLIAFAGLYGCATPAVVFVSPDYNPQKIKSVAVTGFTDAAGQSGSGAMVAGVFEKYLLNLSYQVVDAAQPERDGNISGSVTEITDTSEQTVMVDVPQEVTEPVYQDVVVGRRHGDARIATVQTGTQTNFVDQSVPETETLPARVAISVRMVDAKNGQLLWSGSASADGMDIPSATDAVSSKVVEALKKSLASRKPAASN